MTGLKLIIFDVDGTLVDSQADILASMNLAFQAVGQPVPTRNDVLGVVGLSLPLVMARLAPELTAAQHDTMVETYKSGYARLRAAGGTASSPLYPGIRALLDDLNSQQDLLLGVATGKSRRGLTALIDSLDLHGYFVTTQVADTHPSKPHPSMVLAALDAAGVAAQDAVMIGDTSFDMEMAAAAGVPAIGVTWGYHPDTALQGAQVLVRTAPQLREAIDQVLGI